MTKKKTCLIFMMLCFSTKLLPGETASVGQSRKIQSILVPIPNSFFVIDNTRRTWSGCKSEAATLGFTFASVHNDAENNVIKNAINQSHWIGGYQAANADEPADGWLWDDGSTFNYTKWGAGEPDNFFGPEEDYLAIGVDGFWNDGVGSIELSCVYLNIPSDSPFLSPSTIPTQIPSASPSVAPSLVPSTVPTQIPSASPSSKPSIWPSVIQSASPSASSHPTVSPTSSPTIFSTPSSTVPPTASPTTSPATTLSPTFTFDTGFGISANFTTSTNVITFFTTFGPLTDKGTTELLDASCTNTVTKLLDKVDSSTRSDGELVVTSIITLKPDEIENYGDQGILFSSDGTLLSNSLAISGFIKFCLKSSSIQTFDSSSLELEMKSLMVVYSFSFNGTDTGFVFDVGVNEPDASNEVQIDDFFTGFTIIPHRCSSNSTDHNNETDIDEGDDLYLCIFPSVGDIIGGVDLSVLYSYNPTSNDYEEVFPLISDDSVISGLTNIAQMEVDENWIRFKIKMISSFVGRLRLEGEGDLGFNLNNSSKTEWGFGKDEVSQSSFDYELNVIAIKEEGCIAKLLRMMKLKFI